MNYVCKLSYAHARTKLLFIKSNDRIKTYKFLNKDFIQVQLLNPSPIMVGLKLVGVLDNVPKVIVFQVFL